MKIKNDINKRSIGNWSMAGYDLMLFQQTSIQAGQFFWVTTLYIGN